MKELSTEQKAKAYDKALVIARSRYSIETEESVRICLELMFPELKESESTCIITEIKNIITYFYGSTNLFVHLHSKEELLAWLEKQGEKPQRIVSAEAKEAMYDKPAPVRTGPIGFDGEPMESKPCEQKPAEKTTWYDNMDDLIADAMIDDIKNADMPEHCKHNRLTWINKHRSKSTEWSKEDEEIIQNLLSLWKEVMLEPTCCRFGLHKDEIVDWLKSLKDRYTWKPSDEQMEALESATENCANSEYQDCLRGLIGQLKKLREE